jgi:hypothetical protein
MNNIYPVRFNSINFAGKSFRWINIFITVQEGYFIPLMEAGSL